MAQDRHRMSAMQAETTEVKLERGKSGLGFNIRGGVDIPHLPEDDGIFVSKIHEEGTAAKDGRLKEGDKIIQVNGHTLTGVTHNEAVSFFRTSSTVNLSIEPLAERKILEERARKEAAEIQPSELPPPDGIPVVYIVIGVAVGIAAVYTGYRYYKSKS